jgi:hypothetical protein
LLQSSCNRRDKGILSKISFLSVKSKLAIRDQRLEASRPSRRISMSNRTAGAKPKVPEHIATINTLIATKQAAVGPKDGRLEVALAISATTALVTVDASTTPFSTNPDDLFDRTFNDAKVGISDDQMAIFKANLTVLLPEITDDIAQIPENSALPIEKVAELVRLSLLAASKPNS